MPAPGKGFEKFTKVSDFNGYVNQPDITSINPGYLIRGSQNVVVKDNSRIGIRAGYELYGAESASSTDPIAFSRVFKNFKGVSHLIRAHGDKIEFAYNDTFYTIKDGFTDVNFRSSRNDFWNTGEQISELPMVNGDTNLYLWSGALTTFASATATTITKEGTTTWAEEGFYKNNIGSIRINLNSNSLAAQTLSFTVGTTAYTYTAGTHWTVGADVNASATNLSNAINNANTGIVSYSDLSEVVISVYDTGAVITAITGATNIIVPSLLSKQVVIAGVVYTYTGGETTTTLTGVTPNPLTPGYAAGVPIVSAMRTYTNSDTNGIPTIHKNDLVEVWDNQILLGAESGRIIYSSRINSVDDFRIRNPRRPGDGGRFNMGANLVSFVVQDGLIVFSGDDDIVTIKKSLSSDLTYESFRFDKLKTSPGEGAQSNELVLPIKNGILYLSNEPAINFLGRVENIEDLQLQNISDLVKIDIQNYDFTGGKMHYHNRDILITVPMEGITLIRNMKDGYWQPPQTLPMNSYVTYNGLLYGNGNLQPETYEMFTGTRDRAITNTPGSGFAIPGTALFSYMNFGDREQFKYFTEWYFEGYMTLNTELNIKFFYDLYGCSGTSLKKINQSMNGNIFCIPPNFGSLGKTSLGKKGLGRGIGSVDDTELPKVHAVVEAAAQDFREMTVEFSTDEIDYQWEILSHGPAVDTSSSQSYDIKI